MKIEEALEIVNKYKDEEIIRKFDEARHEIVLFDDENRKDSRVNRVYYKSDDEYDYYIISPYDYIEYGEQYKINTCGYDCIGLGKNGNNYTINLCLGRIGLNLDQIKEVIDKRIKEPK